MRIVDLLRRESIALHTAPKNKAEAVDLLVDLQVKGGKITDREVYKRDILERENEGTTSVGHGIAIPHAKSDGVSAPSLAAITSVAPVDFNSPEGDGAKLMFMIAVPNDNDLHITLFARLATLLVDEAFRNALTAAVDIDTFLDIIEREERKKFPKENDGSIREKTAPKGGFKLLAVTACPTGIAHTYMSAEALEKAAKTLGVTIKVETDGAGGTENLLTEEEIKACDCIIISADKTVPKERFDGKKVLFATVSDGIKKPEELIKKALSGEVAVYSHAGGKSDFSTENSTVKEGAGRRFYKCLMSGVSNMIPFTVAGGIFIALAFLIDTIAGAPQDSTFGTYTAAARFFKNVGGYAFNFMVPILAAYIGMSIAERPGFLVGMVGGYLASLGSTFANVGGDVPSGFLGGIFAGFVGGYLMLGVEKLCAKMPKTLNGLKPVLIYPLAGLAIVSVMMCAVNPIMGVINTWVSDFLTNMGNSSKILLGCILGAMMAVDMGGPVNKAAYVFGTASIASGNYDVMASVMIGGMVPPIAIALSTTFFKRLWTDEERKNGPVNYIMGLSFITEGAIPYAAADPMRVILSCMAGSAVAGGLSMAFKCTLMAPHGGIFVIAVVGNWAMYILSLALGSAAGMAVLSFLKSRKMRKAQINQD